MVNKKLLENVSKLGVPLVMPEEKVDVHWTLAEAFKSKDARLLENFPALLAQASQRNGFDLQKAARLLKDAVDKNAFHKLTALSKAFYESYHLTLPSLATLKPWSDVLERSEVSVGGVKLSMERVKTAFEDYLSRVKLDEKKQLVKHQGLSLEYALSQVFSPKQKELFYKKLNGEVLTKTEREYFSRTVKKKVTALANTDLNALARRVLE